MCDRMLSKHIRFAGMEKSKIKKKKISFQDAFFLGPLFKESPLVPPDSHIRRYQRPFLSRTHARRRGRKMRTETTSHESYVVRTDQGTLMVWRLWCIGFLIL